MAQSLAVQLCPGCDCTTPIYAVCSKFKSTCCVVPTSRSFLDIALVRYWLLARPHQLEPLCPSKLSTCELSHISACMCAATARQMAAQQLSLWCSILDGNGSGAVVATAQLFAAPFQHGMHWPVGIRLPVYVSLVKKVGRPDQPSEVRCTPPPPPPTLFALPTHCQSLNPSVAFL